ncbi:MAG TPA: CopG family transcriptional regulator [Bryobacteraceae bacterium]|nr:CopG family transcriptional regulator [Bryobacteraceae bacterium]
MKTVRIVLGTALLKAVDSAARRRKMNRSALIREALREHLKQARVLDLEERDRRGYQKRSQSVEEYRPWQKIAAWP